TGRELDESLRRGLAQPHEQAAPRALPTAGVATLGTEMNCAGHDEPPGVLSETGTAVGRELRPRAAGSSIWPRRRQRPGGPFALRQAGSKCLRMTCWPAGRTAGRPG